MNRQALTAGLVAILSSFALGQQPWHGSAGRTLHPVYSPAASAAPVRLAFLSDREDQDSARKENKRLSKDEKKKLERQKKEEKKARERQKKEDEKARKREAKNRKKELEQQRKEDARLRKKSRKEEDKQIADERKHERKDAEKEEHKAVNKGVGQTPQRAVALPPPAPASPKVDADHDRDSARSRDGDRDRVRDQDRDRQVAHSRDRDRDDQLARSRDTHVGDREDARARDNREHYDRDQRYDRDRYDRDAYRFRRAIPVSHTAPPDALRAQRNVSRAIYSQMPSSNVMVFLNNANQIVLRGSAPSTSFRDRLLRLAGAVAGGYSIVDQLASDAVSSAAGAMTSAAIGGVGDLIHGSGSNSSQPPPNSDAPGYTSQQQPYPATPPPTSEDRGTPNHSNLVPGENACANVNNNNQVLLTGQAVSQADADLIRQFAQQLGGSSAAVIDQLATRSNGGNSNMPPSSTPATAPTPTYGTAGVVTPGSMVCVNVDSNSQVVLTGTVGSPAELAAVEHTAQPLAGGAGLVDQLTIGAVDTASRAATTGGMTGAATSTGTAVPGSSAAIAASSQPMGPPAATTSAPVVDSDLEQALHSIPRLSNVDAEVTGGSVRLFGTADSSADDQLAREIVQQYAPGRGIVDNVTLTGNH